MDLSLFGEGGGVVVLGINVIHTVVLGINVIHTVVLGSYF